jgi:hypothetical protein
MRNAIIAREQLAMLIRRIFDAISILIAVMELPAEKLELIKTTRRFEEYDLRSFQLIRRMHDAPSYNPDLMREFQEFNFNSI